MEHGHNAISFCQSEGKVSFFIAAYDQDYLRRIKSLMGNKGYVGVTDSAGRIHYIIDGRRGAGYAADMIERKTGLMMQALDMSKQNLMAQLPDVVNQCLANHQIRTDLKGYRYLRYLLLVSEADEKKLKPISKTLYPVVATHFQVSIVNVERDIRYLLSKSAFKASGTKPSAAICMLFDEVTQTLSAIRNNTVQFQDNENSKQSYQMTGDTAASPILKIADS